LCVELLQDSTTWHSPLAYSPVLSPIYESDGDEFENWQDEPDLQDPSPFSPPNYDFGYDRIWSYESESESENEDAGTLAAPSLKLSDIPEPVLGKRRRDDEDEDEDKENRFPKQQKSEWDSSDDEPVVSNGPISPVPVYSCPREIRPRSQSFTLSSRSPSPSWADILNQITDG